MKKWIMIAAAVVLALGLTSCKSGSPSPSGGRGETESSQAVQADLSEIHEAVKNIYGDEYIPSFAYDAQMMEDLFGISGDLYEEYIGEGPMISAHIDNFLAVKAKEGKGREVEDLLAGYRDSLLLDSMQYPANQLKIQASQVVRHGDYVFFVMLGAPDPQAEEKGEEAALESAKAGNQKAVDAIDGFFIS